MTFFTTTNSGSSNSTTHPTTTTPINNNNHNNNKNATTSRALSSSSPPPSSPASSSSSFSSSSSSSSFSSSSSSSYASTITGDMFSSDCSLAFNITALSLRPQVHPYIPSTPHVPTTPIPHTHSLFLSPVILIKQLRHLISNPHPQPPHLSFNITALSLRPQMLIVERKANTYSLPSYTSLALT